MQMALEMAYTMGKTLRFWFGTQLGVAILDPRDIEVIKLIIKLK